VNISQPKLRSEKFDDNDDHDHDDDDSSSSSSNNNNNKNNEKLKEKFGSCTRKAFDRFTKRDSYTWNITHNMESTAV